MAKLFLALLLSFVLNAQAQKELAYSPGVTIDPGIESICKSRKDLNSFRIDHYINDNPSTQPTMNFISGLPLLTVTSVDKEDTLLTFIGMVVPWGFQIKLNGLNSEVETFVSSKSCKCFKDSLSKTEASYGAGAKSTLSTLVLSKATGIKKGDKIYGYVKARGGNIYHFSQGDQTYEKWNFQYEGFFVIEFQPVGQ